MTATKTPGRARWNLWTGGAAALLLAGALAACTPDPDGNPGAAGSSGAGSSGAAGSNAAGSAGSSAGGAGATSLAPGKAGSGRLAYPLLEESSEIVEVMDLDEAKVLYRSTLEEGYLQHFFLTPSGRHLVWDGNSEEAPGARVCWVVDLDTGARTSCALGSAYQLSFVTGVSADGARVSYDTFTSEFKRIIAVWEGGQVTEAPPSEDGWTSCSACGGLSPDGQTVYSLRYGSSGIFPPVKLWRHPLGGAAAEVASLPEGISIQIQDNFLRMSEDGARAIFDCRSEQFPKTKQGTCGVDLATGALTVYPDLLSPSLQQDGKQLAGHPGFGALEVQLFAFGSVVPVATFASKGVWPTLAPDGGRLAFKAMVNGDGGYAPSTAALDGSDVVEVQGNGQSGPQGWMIWAR